MCRGNYEVNSEKMLTFPFDVSESWRVQIFERFIEPSFKDIARPIVAVECSDMLLKDAVEANLFSVKPTKCN